MTRQTIAAAPGAGTGGRRFFRRGWQRSAPARTVLVTFGMLVVGTWQVAVGGRLVAWDWSFHLYADARHPGGAAKVALDWFASLTGERLFTIPVVGLVAAAVARRHHTVRPLVATAAGLLTIAVVGYAVKLGLGRSAPWTGADDLLAAGGRAFPSGHAANAAFTWIFVVVLLYGARGLRPDRLRLAVWAPPAALLALVTGAVMALLDYHWLSDVPGGWLLGVLALAVAVGVLDAPDPRLDTSPRAVRAGLRRR